MLIFTEVHKDYLLSVCCASFTEVCRDSIVFLVMSSSLSVPLLTNCVHADVNAALGLVDLFPREDEEMEDVSALRESHSAYVELLKYAPCLVRFEDRATVFQELVRRDREVSSPFFITNAHCLTHVSVPCSVFKGFACVLYFFWSFFFFLQSVRSSEPRRMMSKLVVTVHRNSVFEDGLELLKDLSSVDLKSPLRISFIDEHGTLEAGIDGGGLFKDFIECLLQVCAPSLLRLTSDAAGFHCQCRCCEHSSVPHMHVLCTGSV